MIIIIMYIRTNIHGYRLIKYLKKIYIYIYAHIYKKNSHDTFLSVVRHNILTKWDMPKVTPTVSCSIKVAT